MIKKPAEMVVMSHLNLLPAEIEAICNLAITFNESPAIENKTFSWHRQDYFIKCSLDTAQQKMHVAVEYSNPKFLDIGDDEASFLWEVTSTLQTTSEKLGYVYSKERI